ncbi:hypothetical protein A8U91_01795 [Halomonas elongata]|uniref:Uncharacterized protein n=1 Tax=Halomonas elongata TaxID=2746 RepID=A0A1B8P5E0_HALEL|nr:hypothetical protein A8U91_01795 [Halomonas elongata]
MAAVSRLAGTLRIAGRSSGGGLQRQSQPLGPPAWLGDWLAGAVDSLTRYPDPMARRPAWPSPGTRTCRPSGHGDPWRHRGDRTHRRRACRWACADRGADLRRVRHGVSAARAGRANADLAWRGFRAGYRRTGGGDGGCRAALPVSPEQSHGEPDRPRAVERLLARGRETRTTLVVDEAFVDFVDGDAG